MSLLRSAITPFEQSWASIQVYYQGLSETHKQITALNQNLVEMENERNTKRQEREALQEQFQREPFDEGQYTSILFSILLSPFSTSKSNEDTALQALDNHINNVDSRISETTANINKLRDHETPYYQHMIRLSVIQMIGLVAGSIFASLAILSIVSGTGIAAVVTAGAYCVPVLIFHDLFFTAKNLQEMTNRERATPITGPQIRSFFRSVVYFLFDADPTDDNNNDSVTTRFS